MRLAATARPVAIPEPSPELLVRHAQLRDGRARAARVRHDDRRTAGPSNRLRTAAGTDARRASRCSSSAPACRACAPPSTLQTRRRAVHDRRDAGHGRRRVVGEPVPRRRRRHAEPPVLVLVRALRLVEVLRPARRVARLPRARRRPVRPAPPHPVRHRGRARPTYDADGQHWAVDGAAQRRQHRGRCVPTVVLSASASSTR